MSGQFHAAAALPNGKRPRCPLGRRLGGPEGRVDAVARQKLPASASNRTQVVQIVDSKKLVHKCFSFVCVEFGFLFMSGTSYGQCWVRISVKRRNNQLWYALTTVGSSVTLLWFYITIATNESQSKVVITTLFLPLIVEALYSNSYMTTVPLNQNVTNCMHSPSREANIHQAGKGISCCLRNVWNRLQQSSEIGCAYTELESAF